MPHLQEPANTNKADATVSQCRRRERFGEAGDKQAASRRLLVCIMEEEWKEKCDKMAGEGAEDKMMGRVKGNEAWRDG